MKSTALLLILILFPLFSREPIKWACGEYAPAYYKTESNVVTGFLYDIAKEALEERMGIPVEITFYPWKRCQYLVEKGEADMMFTIPTPERKIYAVTHNTPAWVKKRILYTYEDHERLDEINKIRNLEEVRDGNYTVLSYIGNNWIESSVEEIGIKVRYAPGTELIYRMLAARRGDLIIEETAIADRNITREEVEHKVVKTEGIGSESGFHICIAKSSPYADIVDSLNSVIEAMWDDGTIDSILIKYNVK